MVDRMVDDWCPASGPMEFASCTGSCYFEGWFYVPSVFIPYKHCKLLEALPFTDEVQHRAGPAAPALGRDFRVHHMGLQRQLLHHMGRQRQLLDVTSGCIVPAHVMHGLNVLT